MPLIFTCQARDLARGRISQQLSVSALCVTDYTPFLLGQLDLLFLSQSVHTQFSLCPTIEQ